MKSLCVLCLFCYVFLHIYSNKQRILWNHLWWQNYPTFTYIYISYHENFKLKKTVQSDPLHDHSLSPPVLVLNQGWQYFDTVSFVFNAWYVLFSIYVTTYLQFILLWIFAYLFVLLYYKLACSTTCSPIMTSIIVLYIR